MTFVYPHILYALFAVIIPIIIHLFNLQKPKSVYFPNVHLLKNIEQETSKKLKIKNILILLSRILFIIALVLAFAQPIEKLTKQASDAGRPLNAVYVDNSFSMQNNSGEKSGLDWAFSSVQKMTDQLPVTSEYHFITNDFAARDRVILRKDKFLERMNGLRFSNEIRTLEDVHQRQLQQLSEFGAYQKNLIWISDFQKSTIGDLKSFKPDTSIQYFVVPVQTDKVKNIYIDSVWLAGPYIRNNESNILQLRIINAGTETADNLLLKLFIDNIQVSTNEVSLKEGDSKVVEFKFLVQGSGQKRAEIRFDDAPIAFDNSYYFVLNLFPKIKILNISDRTSKLFEYLYGNESIFEIQSNKAGEVNYSSLQSYNLIVLDAMQSYSDELSREIKNYLRKGGSVVFVPNENNSADQLRSFFTIQGLGAVSQIKKDTSDKLGAQLMTVDYANPFFKGIFEKEESTIQMPFAYSSFKVAVSGLPLLTKKNGIPLLSCVERDAGKLYIVTAPLNDAYTNFHKHSLFVPIFYKMAYESIVEGERIAWKFSDPMIRIPSKEFNAEDVWQLTNESNSIRIQPLFDGSSVQFSIPEELKDAGFYKIKKGNTDVADIAVNRTSKESKLEQYSASEMKDILGVYPNVKILDDQGTGALSQIISETTIAKTYWRWCIIVALFFLLTETLLFRFWK